MYQNFNIIKVETDSIQRQVIIHFNLDIDTDTVTKRALKLIDNETAAILPYKLKSTAGYCYAFFTRRSSS